MADTLVTIESLDNEGRGVARCEGKAVFVEGALPGERVAMQTIKRKPSYEIARAVAIQRPSPSRVTPRCPHFGVCGGCSLQHASTDLQVAAKQRVLEEALARIGKVRPGRLLAPLHGPAWGYRNRARLSVRNVPRKGGVLVGFHERRSSYVADMLECHVVPPRISALLPVLRKLIESLSIATRVPQIELAVGESMDVDADGSRADVYALVFRILEPLSDEDEARLRAFGDAHDVHVWLQTGGPATAQPFHPKVSQLVYTLPEFDVVMPFGPTDFTQVNPHINRVLVRRAMALLRPQPEERIADFFCGLGNFTLPMARRGATVIGIEGSAAVVERARENAGFNRVEERAQFAVANLFAATPDSVASLMPLAKALIDPPREGAIELVKSLPARDAANALERIVYVSCNPATLARDAGALVHERGYVLETVGVVNMFPHTAHVESIASFVR
ncbi:MAG TPA: 23S rRNA (uracil(1939)-C(5))-methyltransferase RlmD [Casimicrobiaceae bacterium]|nr:23S rRNA (uracil(1939)-C(5))-methyltransferase RlmD [Casimicrobiaceae bacterium]